MSWPLHTVASTSPKTHGSNSSISRAPGRKEPATLGVPEPWGSQVQLDLPLEGT